MRIDGHKLTGANVVDAPTENRGGNLAAKYLVFHYTAGADAESAVRSLCTKKPSGNASAHVVIGRDGRIFQLAPFNVVTWHAGESYWNGLTGLNQHSIGIEMDNAGRLQKVGEAYLSWFKRAYPQSEVIQAAHKNESAPAYWHDYTEVQVGAALELAELLAATYGLGDVLGHEDIAPGRKSDPGPAFPLESIRSRVAGRQVDAQASYSVNATLLNIRSGPGAHYPIIAAALPRGTVVAAIDRQKDWQQVKVGGGDTVGWVAAQFLVPIPA